MQTFQNAEWPYIQPHQIEILFPSYNQIKGMKFIFILLIKLILFLALITLLYEILNELIIYYYSLELTNELPTWQGIIANAEKTLNISIYYFIELKINEFKFVQLIVWVYIYHVYYLVLIFVLLILFYQYKLKTLNTPKISRKEQISPQSHDAEKQFETEREVAKLVNSPQYQAFKNGSFPYVISDEQDEVTKQLQEKVDEIFD